MAVLTSKTPTRWLRFQYRLKLFVAAWSRLPIVVKFFSALLIGGAVFAALYFTGTSALFIASIAGGASFIAFGALLSLSAQVMFFRQHNRLKKLRLNQDTSTNNIIAPFTYRSNKRVFPLQDELAIQEAIPLDRVKTDLQKKYGKQSVDLFSKLDLEISKPLRASKTTNRLYVQKVSHAIAKFLHYKTLVKKFLDPKTLEKELALRVVAEETARKLFDAGTISSPLFNAILKLLESYPEPLTTQKALFSIAKTLPENIANEKNAILKASLVLDLEALATRQGLLLSKEIANMQRLFKLRREALNATDKLKPTGFLHPLYLLQKQKDSKHPDIIAKDVEKLGRQNELSAIDQAVIGGFSSVVLTMAPAHLEKRIIHRHPQEEQKHKFDKTNGTRENTGNLLVKPFSNDTTSKNKKHHHVLFQPFLEGSIPADNIDDRLRAESNSKTPDKDTIRQYTNMLTKMLDPTSYQMTLVYTLLIGMFDSHPGNILLKDHHDKIKIYSIDHESIMGESNTRISKPISTKTTVDVVIEKNGKKETTKKTVHKDVSYQVFPIRSWLLGLPEAKKPFDQKVIRHVLRRLHTEDFAHYHAIKKIFSDKAVAAQQKRIKHIRKLFEKELKKSTITLTPFQLFEFYLNQSSSYRLMRDKMKLSDFTIFHELGHVESSEVTDQLKHPNNETPVGRLAVLQKDMESIPEFQPLLVP